MYVKEIIIHAMKQATPNIRTIDHADHTDIERLFYVYSLDGKGEYETKAIWAVVWCGLKQEKQAMTESTYEFSYAMQRLRDAIDYAQTDGDFQQARIWSNHVEKAYNADIASEQELTANANEGAKLMHSLATGGESKLLKDWDLLDGCGNDSDLHDLAIGR